MLENKKTAVQDVHYSRYIASWHNAGGDYFGYHFEEWLKACGCSRDEISDITLMAINGKMELEKSATPFIKWLKQEEAEAEK